MTAVLTPPSTEAPRAARLPKARWWDSRLVVGVLLMLISIVVGTRVVAAADDTTPVWVAATDLPAGSTLRGGDLEVAQVRLESSADRYVGTAGDSPVGLTLERDVAAGELLPLAALVARPTSGFRLVTLPVESHHFPSDLSRGDHVDVYVTVDPAEPGAAPESLLVLEQARVDRVEENQSRLGSVGGVGVTLAVDPDLVRQAVNGIQRGAVDLVLADAP
ncbi:MAG: SAF domain-containing protein [Candidatus Nanopelagicales bacterium]